MPLEGCFPLAPSFDHAGPMERDVETWARMLAALASGFERAELARSRTSRSASPGWSSSSRLYAPRSGGGGAVPAPGGEIGAVFMREATESHRGLFPEHAHASGANVRAKLECCLVVHAEFERGRRRHAEIASGAAEAIGESSGSSRGIIATVPM